MKGYSVNIMKNNQNKLKSSSKPKTKIVGVSIDDSKKTYYYRTTQDLKKGDKFRGRVVNGGTPNFKVVVEDSKKKHKRIKDLEIVE